ncbi:MAG: FHA domain-containing protein [Anaerolineae bacterium]|nr:FHA domain-containing protein [Anaerolineae bacterium]MDQ7037243.1 FHA domain-containing protein [Anaerolineae bacterium]
MTLDWNLFLRNLVTYLPVGLGLVALIQVVYATFLSITGTVEDRANQPTHPVMPRSSGAWSQDKLSSGLPTILAQVGSGPGTGGVTGVTDHGVSGKFVVEAGMPEAKDLALPAYEFGIGRFFNEEQQILMAIDERSISRHHALFAGDEDLREYYLIDTESTYGTFLFKEGQFEQIEPNLPVRVFNQDVVQLGSKVRLRLILPTETREQAIR